MNYDDVFAALSGPLTPADGVPEGEIAANERRLGVRLPTSLRQYYATAGNERRLNTAYNRLRPPATWKLDRGMLLFLSENQGVIEWGVPATRARRSNPAVSFATHFGRGEYSDWLPEDLPCSDFLVLMLCWQAVHGGMPHTGWMEVAQPVATAVAARWGPAWRSRDLAAHYRPGQALCLAGSSGRLDLLAAARSGPEFEAMERELAGFGVELEVS